MVEKKAFLLKPKHQCHLSQRAEWVYRAQSWKEKRLLCESVFVPIDKQTLTIKNDGKERFLMKAKHQYHLSQWRECVYGTQSQKERRLLSESVFDPIDKWTLTLKKWWKEKRLL